MTRAEQYPIDPEGEELPDWHDDDALRVWTLEALDFAYFQRYGARHLIERHADYVVDLDPKRHLMNQIRTGQTEHDREIAKDDLARIVMAEVGVAYTPPPRVALRGRPRNDLPRQVIRDAETIREIWARYFGRRNRDRGRIGALEIAAEWCLTRAGQDPTRVAIHDLVRSASNLVKNGPLRSR
ncbi:hypothetical protein AUC68_11250 [Methyloceanibacter methanicus]|uniref:Uncharacterized protein n=1 Tax=Methyloceanibacter methanicus TaxID=1774968 RepID=A0A1E3VWZ9_9HYPH|nr:hypothetical protein [Methyloceanibacter methanicus]ODR98068.1 hypothetical protein AUC68_11250 [Methyloceanibacter methanicus]